MILTNAILTAYCACRLCCGEATGLAADGRLITIGAVAAPRHIPFGTRVHIPGLGTRVVRDRTALRYNGRWDVYVRTHREAKRFGIKTATIKIIP